MSVECIAERFVMSFCKDIRENTISRANPVIQYCMLSH